MDAEIYSLPVIQSLWIGKELSRMEQLCISSFLDKGHPFHLYTYDIVKGVPDGTILLDANQIIPKENVFKNKDRDTYAGFSNLFRYKLLFERGEYWVDTDVVCLKPFELPAEYVFASAKDEFGREDCVESCVESCVIKAPKGSPIMRYCYEIAVGEELNALWGKVGPSLLSAAIVKYKMAENIVDADVFCPIGYWDYKKITGMAMDLLLPDFSDNTLAIHLWNEMWRTDRNKIWRRGGLDKNKHYRSDSLYERLYTKYFSR